VLYDRCMMQALNPCPAAREEASAGPVRPLLADPVAAEARFHARQPIYRRLARLTVDTATLSTEETVAALLSGLIKTTGKRR
jgi:shikimate kinase